MYHLLTWPFGLQPFDYQLTLGKRRLCFPDSSDTGWTSGESANRNDVCDTWKLVQWQLSDISVVRPGSSDATSESFTCLNRLNGHHFLRVKCDKARNRVAYQSTLWEFIFATYLVGSYYFKQKNNVFYFSEKSKNRLLQQTYSYI